MIVSEIVKQNLFMTFPFLKESVFDGLKLIPANEISFSNL